MKKLLLFLVALPAFVHSQLPDLIPYRLDSLWGYCDSALRVVIEPRYDSVGFFRAGIANAKNEQRYFLIDSTGRELPLKGFDAVRLAHHSYPENPVFTEAKVAIASVDSQLNGLYLIDLEGRILTQRGYSDIGNFNYGIAKATFEVTQGNRWWSKPVYYDGFSQWFEYKGESTYTLTTYINLRGKELIPPASYANTEMEPPFIVAESHEGFGMVDTTGRIIIPFKYRRMKMILSSQRGYPAFFMVENFPPDHNVRYSYPCALANSRGQVITSFHFQAINRIVDGLVLVEDGSRIGCIDTNGTWVIPAQYDYHYGHNNTETPFLFSKGEKYVFLDEKGAELFVGLADKYDEVEPFRIGRALVTREGLYGSINDRGEEIVPPRYKKIQWYTAYAEVQEASSEGLWGLIDSGGKVVIPLIYEDVKYAGMDLVFFKKNGNWGAMVIQTGQILVPATYKFLYRNCGLIFAGQVAGEKMDFYQLDGKPFQMPESAKPVNTHGDLLKLMAGERFIGWMSQSGVQYWKDSQ